VDLWRTIKRGSAEQPKESVQMLEFFQLCKVGRGVALGGKQRHLRLVAGAMCRLPNK